MSAFKDPSSSSNPDSYLTENLRLDWILDFNTRVIAGTVILSVKKVEISKGAIPLVLDTNRLVVESVKVSDAPAEWKLIPSAHDFMGSALEIPVPDGLERFEVEIKYKTSPEAGALQWLEAQTTADKRLPFMFSQCQAILARSLFPCQDTPCVKATFEATVHAPKDVAVVMGATRCAEASVSPCGDALIAHRFKQAVPIPSYLVTIAAGDIVSKRIGPRSMVWAEPSVVDKAARVFAETEQMLAAAEELCRPYQWKVYDILVLPPSFPYGGMENPCLTFVSPTILAEDRSAVNVVAHEIAHSWTGNLVTNTTWEHFWLNEGHTVYLERLIMEKLHGSQTRQLLLALGYVELVAEVNALGMENPFTKLVTNLSGVDPDHSYNRIPYEKGSLLLYRLETMVGKAAMLGWLKAYIDKYAGLALDTTEWRKFLSSQLGSKVDELDWTEWCTGLGMPPWMPEFDAKELMDECKQLVDLFISPKLPSDDALAKEVVQLWGRANPFQHEMAMNQLLKQSPVNHASLNAIESCLHFCSEENCDLRFIWSLTCARSQYLPALDSSLAFLNSQSRLKYTRPLYKALNAWSEVREGVHENFRKQRPFMHQTTASLVAEDIGYAAP